MKPNFNTMSKEELRQYVISHQNDKEAFYKYVELLKSSTSRQIYSNSLSPSEIEQAILERLQNL